MHAIISFTRSHTLPLLLLVALLTGAVVYKDFGIAWDEEFSRWTALANYDYVFNNDDRLLTLTTRHYGMAFELPAAIVEKTLGLTDLRDIYLMRRIMCYALFLTACCCVFLITKSFYRSRLAAVAAFLMLWLHPQMFSHAFFNSKDIPFLSFLAITLYLLFKAWRRNSWWLICLAGISAGLMTGTRIPGVIYLLLCSAWIIAESVFARKISRGLLWTSLFCVCWMLALLLSWPYLWESPIANFTEAFNSMSNFNWNYTVLYGDLFYEANQLPWHYIPAWFAMSMPLLFLAAGVAGVIIPFWYALAKFRLDFTVRTGIFLVLCMVLPVITVIVLDSIVYDSWRHLFFIYVPFVLLCAGAINMLHNINRLAAGGAIALLIAPVIWFHIQAHPLQYVHFNVLTRHKYEDLVIEYEMDYWGVGYKQGLEYLLQHDTARVITVSAPNVPLRLNAEFLPKEQRERIKIVPVTEARYFLANYRMHRHEYDDLPVKTHQIKRFKVRGNTVHTVHRIGE